MGFNEDYYLESVKEVVAQVSDEYEYPSYIKSLRTVHKQIVQKAFMGAFQEFLPCFELDLSRSLMNEESFVAILKITGLTIERFDE